jgi:hypothetical protein
MMKFANVQNFNMKYFVLSFAKKNYIIDYTKMIISEGLYIFEMCIIHYS